MLPYRSSITYNGISIVAEVETAEDSDIQTGMQDRFLPMVIKLDMEIRKLGLPVPEHYRVICAHGGGYRLYDQRKPIMSKDQAANMFDIMMVCNNEHDIWTPQPGSRVANGAYAKGKPGGGMQILEPSVVKSGDPDLLLELRCGNGLLDENDPDLPPETRAKVSQNPNGKRISVLGTDYSFIYLEGNIDRSGFSWTDRGIEVFAAENLRDRSELFE